MTATPRAVELVETAALAAADKLADGIIAYDVSDQLVITDAFLLCSAFQTVWPCRHSTSRTGLGGSLRASSPD